MEKGMSSPPCSHSTDDEHQLLASPVGTTHQPVQPGQDPGLRTSRASVEPAAESCDLLQAAPLAPPIKDRVTSNLSWRLQTQCFRAKTSATLSFSGRASREVKSSTKNPLASGSSLRGPQSSQPQSLGRTGWGLSDAPSLVPHLSWTQMLPPERPVQIHQPLGSLSRFLAQ